MGQMTQPTMS